MIDTAQLENILAFYKCPCKVVNTRTGGGFIDYYLQPVNGTTINKVAARVNDFTLALGQNVNIAFENMTLILRTKDTAGAPVYNILEYAGNLEPREGQVAFGINPRGEYVQYNLFEMPHLLVAGATGSGKSVFLHNVILTLGQSQNIVFTLIDLKRVEMSIYNGLNKVDGGAITDAAEAKTRLAFEVSEMENRYKIMEAAGVRHYTSLPAGKGFKARVIIIDELADLMLNRETRQSVENSIVRIAQLGRAAGVHLILATQRPSADVITGLIKANIPWRLSFMTASQVDSRVIGCKGAENLNGHGDALLLKAGAPELERFQAFYISESDLLYIINETIKTQTPQTPQTYRTKSRRAGFFKRMFG